MRWGKSAIAILLILGGLQIMPEAHWLTEFGTAACFAAAGATLWSDHTDPEDNSG